MGFEIKNGILTKYTEEPGVKEIVIPDSITSTGKDIFYGCSHLNSVTPADHMTD